MFSAQEILEEFVDAQNVCVYKNNWRYNFPTGGYRTFANRFFGPRREHYLATNRKYQKTWRERNREKHNAQERARYWKTKDKRNAYCKAYVAAQKARDPVAWKAKKKEYRDRYERKRRLNAKPKRLA